MCYTSVDKYNLTRKQNKKANTKIKFVDLKEKFMNILNNSRFQSTEEKIEKAFLTLLHFKTLNSIFVKDICFEAGINRSSFYAHYTDINDLMIKLETKLSKEIAKIFSMPKVYQNEDFVKLFEFLQSKKEFYQAYFQSNEIGFLSQKDFKNLSGKHANFLSITNNYSKVETYYHLAFFAGGLQAISKMWLTSGCKESPKQMADIIFKEYNLNAKYSKL